MGDYSYTSSSHVARTYCYVHASGNLMPSKKTFGACTKIFQKYNVEEGSSWKNIPQSTKDFYFKEFEKEFHWDEGNWSTPEHVAKSMKYSKNRLTEKGGEGAGPSKHIGGSITHEEHAKHIQNANTDKVPPTVAELFLHTYTKKSDRNKFVDKRAEIVYVIDFQFCVIDISIMISCKYCKCDILQENYLKLKEQHSSQYVGLDHVEGDGGTINENHLFITAAEGWQGSRVYGLGSAASSAFSQTGTEGILTNVPSS
ncbi:uncharacterized protein LOC110619016 [Manihot esculenta]|uniref:uncharacterized protein LOC110619016 n=1 Tax=Manihot esculenta TaxID=3983 RepID=UPI001CC48C4D|nr:uncharacterized protein LOC110619016 [Manihot esculenta]